MPRSLPIALSLLFPAALTPAAVAADFTPEQIQFFESKVRPVLATHCVKCHGPDKQNNNLRLDSRASIIKGSSYGPVVKEGKPDASKLLKAIRHEPGVEAMPKDGAKLPDDAIAALTEWIAQGLPWPADAAAPPPEKWRSHWAFQPVKMPAIPAPEIVPDSFGAWRGSEMDRIIFKKLTDSGLTPSPVADRAILLRRAFMTLLGVPPTYEQVQDFLRDTSPDVWPRVVDKILDAPQYGERQARHWMDVARYADTKGYVFQEERRYAYAYTYRDWLIRAFNADLPYDQFLIRQIAADKSTDWQKEPADLAAMGFLTLGRRFLNNQTDIIDDRLDVIFRGTQAMTVGCARCHDHKFDPIPTADYYALYGVLANSHEPDNKPELAKAERTPEFDAFEKGVAEREAKAAAYRQERLDEIRKPENLAKYRTAAAEIPDKGGEGIRRFARDRDLNSVFFTKWIEWRKGPGKDAPADATPPFVNEIKPDDIVQGYNRKDREKHKEFANAVEKFKATSPASPPRAMVMFDNNSFNEPVVFERGNPGRPGQKVPRHFLSALSPDKSIPLTEGSGRLQLAKAIASAENPLTARVFVNRLWSNLCGDTLVDTPADFGVRTAPPLNPALLDYLAATFVADGWSIKKLTRRILLSAAWQQSSAPRPDMEAKDPENRLFFRQNRQRLDFEALRDSLLRVSGTLDGKMFGKPEDILTEPFTGRRTIYGFIDRQNLPGLFRTFDFASPDATAPRRYETIVPQQALYMMNNPFVSTLTRRMVQELHAQPDKDPRHWIAQLYHRILQRDPSPDEIETSLRSVEALHREPRQTATRWQNGFGSYNGTEKKVTFTPLPWFGKDRWSASENLPDPQHGWVMLTNTGGHPGDSTHAAIRRWNAPESATVRISGELILPAKESTGVRAFIVHSRKGLLWSSDLKPASKASAEPAPVAVAPGDTIDFILDSGADPNSDSFQWSPVIRDTMSGLAVANASRDFGGPGTSAWEAYTQVLLCTNEFMFVD